MSTESKTIKELLAKVALYESAIGIDNDLNVYEGYRTPLYQADLEPEEIESWRGVFTANEKRLLANEMICRWTEYRNCINPAAGAPGIEP